MSDRPKLVFDVVGIDSDRDGKVVTIEGRVPKLMPDLIADNRARLKSIVAAGVVDTGAETIEDLSEGNLSRLTELVDRGVLEEDTATQIIEYHILVRG